MCTNALYNDAFPLSKWYSDADLHLKQIVKSTCVHML
jgi:hypothetical protein